MKKHSGSSGPIIIAHRGASGIAHEHTRRAYELAIRHGADFVELDLVVSKDGHLIVRHERNLKHTTNVARIRRFRHRSKRKRIRGKLQAGWFVEDFTLAEIGQLVTRERMRLLRWRNQTPSNRSKVLSLREAIRFIQQMERKYNRSVGLYIELKSPGYFRTIGFDVERKLIEALDSFGYKRKQDRIFIQCFEPATLKRIKRLTSYRLIQLIWRRGSPPGQTENQRQWTYRELFSDAGFDYIGQYADGIGIDKHLALDSNGLSPQFRQTLRNAQRRKLLVHVFTFRRERIFIMRPFRKRQEASATKRGAFYREQKYFFDQGVDGIFSDHVAESYRSRKLR